MSGLAHVMSDLGEMLRSFGLSGVYEERDHTDESRDCVTEPASEEKSYNRVQSAPLLKCMVESLSNESKNVSESEVRTDVDSAHPHGLVELIDGNDSEEFPESFVTSDESGDEDTPSRPAVSELVGSFEETAEDDRVWALIDAIKLAGEVTAVEDGIEHDMFATATDDGFNKIMDALLTGMMPAHGIVRRDTRANLQKIAEGCRKIGISNLREMVEAEIAQSVEWSNSGREAVLWLKRTLQFLCFALRDFVKSEKESSERQLKHIIKDAYNRTLSGVHGFKAHAFRLFLKGVPPASVFMSRLGDNPAVVVKALELWEKTYAPVVQQMASISRDFGLEECKRMRDFDLLK
ncbi:hypothetical protein NDN08_008316 [Rhodosorus marinus]|uniref:Glycolipid transfer protein domain-containing protein n=1 Tax=Rhodosorus marinus TaxID=101924 RepID=A0AAV8V041_9RHOD|nr:hypothetical protein NDN08_008316 [Rhodosorus marinus]